MQYVVWENVLSQQHIKTLVSSHIRNKRHQGMTSLQSSSEVCVQLFFKKPSSSLTLVDAFVPVAASAVNILSTSKTSVPTSLTVATVGSFLLQKGVTKAKILCA